MLLDIGFSPYIDNTLLHTWYKFQKNLTTIELKIKLKIHCFKNVFLIKLLILRFKMLYDITHLLTKR